MITRMPKGTKDIFGSSMTEFTKVEKTIKDICKSFGVNEIKTPMFEHTELFQRGVGETTDVVQKEMYTFEDKGNRSITLKPENTAGVARAFIEHTMYANTQPTKLFYIEPNFRYENPQAGRFRQHYQFGVEYFGSPHPEAVVEVISLAHTLLTRLGIDAVININSIGGVECRLKYNESLKAFIAINLDSFCSVCATRFEKNPLRILDCKNDKCQELLKDAPNTIDSLDSECKQHFDTVLKLLDCLGITYKVNSRLVRGLDYYTRTVFEFVSDELGISIGGGGRYDNLIEQFGGPSTPGFGFGIGMERLMMALKHSEDDASGVDVFIGCIGERGRELAYKLVYELRKKNICAEMDTLRRSVKAQLKYADKINANYCLILGDNEVDTGKASIKNMKASSQTEVMLDKLEEYLVVIPK